MGENERDTTYENCVETEHTKVSMTLHLDENTIILTTWMLTSQMTLNDSEVSLLIK